jgi:hypothetical protein
VNLYSVNFDSHYWQYILYVTSATPLTQEELNTKVVSVLTRAVAPKYEDFLDYGTMFMSLKDLITDEHLESVGLTRYAVTLSVRVNGDAAVDCDDQPDDPSDVTNKVRDHIRSMLK